MIALTLLVVSFWSLFDFPGQPAPWTRELALRLLALVAPVMILPNLYLDRKGRDTGLSPPGKSGRPARGLLRQGSWVREGEGRRPNSRRVGISHGKQPFP